MRRHPILECRQEESKLLVSMLLREPKHLEHLILNLRVEDSDASPSDLISIQHDIISLRTHSARIAVDIFQIFLHRHGKRMMHRRIAVLFFTPLKQRELCHPQKLILVLIKQIHLTGKLQTKRT